MTSLTIKPLQRIADKTVNTLVKCIPPIRFKDGKLLDGIKWAGQHIAKPYNNRLILGVSAIMSQPFIDLHNRKVDEETKKVSALRTVAKIIAGTFTGYYVRYYTIKAIEAFTNKPIKGASCIKSWFYPKRVKTTINGLKQYKSTLGGFMALGVMLFTNFLIDAPLTKFLTNILVKKYQKNNQTLPQTQQNQYFTRKTIDEFINQTKGGNYGN